MDPEKTNDKKSSQSMVGAGLAIGLAIGIAIGVSLDAKNKKKDD